jgi:serine/threonine protein kinase
MTKDANVVDVIRAIAAGSAVDWDSVDSIPADASIVSVFEELKVIARIADVHGRTGDVPPEPASSDEELQSWGPLTILERIGAGSYGIVYRAWDARLDREVALKLLKRVEVTERSDNPSIDEGRLLARVRHPNVVTVHGADRIDGRAGIWMEFVEGRTLDEIVRSKGPLDAHEAALIGIDVARGLAAVHAAGLVHRDVKPQNVVRQDDGRVVLMDLGAGREVDGARKGGIAGTPLYAAPEALSNSDATPVNDLYSVGVLLFYLVSAAYPIDAVDIAGIRAAHAGGRLRSLSELRPSLPRAFVEIVQRAISPQVAMRFLTAASLEAALASFIAAGDSAPVRTGRRRLLAIAAAVVAAAAIGSGAAVVWQQSRKSAVVFHARDWILISSFANKTGEPVLDGALEYMFDRELGNSTFLNVVSRDSVDETLRLMRRPSDTRIDLSLGREIALRDGSIRALLDGHIEKIGRTYVLTTALINPSTGARAHSFVGEARAVDDLLGVARRQAVEIRRALGEERESLGGSIQQLDKVTTPSFAALRAYSTASATLAHSRIAAPSDLAALAASAESDLRRAIELDPSFASAHILLAWSIFSRQVAAGRSHDAQGYLAEAEAALKLAVQATDAERQFIVASTHDLRAQAAGRWPFAPAVDEPAVVKDDLRQAFDAYEQYLRLQPGDARALNNITQAAERLGREAELADTLDRVAMVRPNSFDANIMAAAARIRIGDLARAAGFVDRAEIAGAPRNESDPPRAARVQLSVLRAKIEWLRHDSGGAARELDRAAGSVDRFENVAALNWRVAGVQVALADLALGRTRAAEAIAAAVPDPDARTAALATVFVAERDTSRLRQLLRDSESHHNILGRGGSYLVNAGLITEARRLADDLEASRSIVPSYVLFVRHAIASAEHRYSDAIALGERSLRLQPTRGNNQTLTISRNMADAYRALGQPARGVSLLEQETSQLAESVGRDWSAGWPWIAARNQLAELYADVGRDDEAAVIDRQLLALLATADGEYSVLRDVKKRVAERR